jgi:DNA topoisomerase I
MAENVQAPEAVEELRRAARSAGLRHVSDDRPGIRRRRWGRGFTYLDAGGKHIVEPAERRRFKELAVPPAWIDVWICPRSDGHLLATGRDEAGRKQYLYHPRWREVRDVTKFERMLPFGRALPGLRKRVDQDLRRRGLPRERVLAATVRLLDATLIRIGNAAYARDNGSYGLTTLENDHVEVTSHSIHFSFPGKAGKEQELDLQDRRLARLVGRCQELPGQTLIQYEDEEGELRRVDSEDVNDYIEEATGDDFTAKDFRTWGASVLVARALREAGPAGSEAAVERCVLEAVDTAAEALGNTREVCRDSYVHPAVVEAYRKGWLAVLGPIRRRKGLEEGEPLLLAILEREAGGDG